MAKGKSALAMALKKKIGSNDEIKRFHTGLIPASLR